MANKFNSKYVKAGGTFDIVEGEFVKTAFSNKDILSSILVKWTQQFQADSIGTEPSRPRRLCTSSSVGPWHLRPGRSPKEEGQPEHRNVSKQVLRRLQVLGKSVATNLGHQ